MEALKIELTTVANLINALSILNGWRDGGHLS